MTVTLQTARAAVRERLGEPKARAWKDVELDRWIYEGCVALARRCETQQTTHDQSVSAGTQTFTMPADVLRIHRVEWQPTGQSAKYPLDYRDYNNADAVWWTSQSTSQGRPAMYTMWGVTPNLKCVLYPTPSSAGTAKIFYYQLPRSWATQVTDDELVNQDHAVLEVPAGWEDAVYLYAEYNALRKDRDPRWQEAQALYREREDMLFDMSRRWTDQPGQFVGANFPTVNAWLYGGGDYGSSGGYW